MNREKLIESVQSRMPARRWEHTLGVMETSVRLARRYGADPFKAELAAILHDVAKYWPAEELEETIRRIPVPEELAPEKLLACGQVLLHAPIGAWIAETEYGITDGEVLDAIRYHTTGRERMTLLDKVVCLADYIEPGRDYPGVERIRELAEENLENALVAGLDSTVVFLISKNKPIFPLTILARNQLLQEGTE